MATFVENFDSYTAGDLTGQGGWSGSTGWDVVTSQFVSSPNAAAGSGATTTDIDKTFTGVGTGNQVFYMRSDTLAVGVTNHAVRFSEGTTFLFGIFLNEGGGSPGDIVLNGSAAVTVATWVIDTWYKIEVEWKTSDNTVRARVNDGTWTAFQSTAATFTNVDTVKMRATALSGVLFVDSFLDATPAPAVNAKFFPFLDRR